jgi:glycine cleavage system H protein
VSSYVAHFETLYLCDDSVLIDLGPGGVFYNLAPLSNDPNQQSVWTDEVGQYVVYAQFPGCGAITSQITVEECPSVCSATISNAGLNYQNCGAAIDLIATYSSPIDSAIWVLGNGDVVFVEIETEGETLNKGETFGTVEAVKTVSDLFMPLTGEVLEFNTGLEADPEAVNRDPYGDGWMIKIKVSDVSQVDNLLDAAAYGELIGG